jgi:hypothetical protein
MDVLSETPPHVTKAELLGSIREKCQTLDQMVAWPLQNEGTTGF